MDESSDFDKKIVSIVSTFSAFMACRGTYHCIRPNTIVYQMLYNIFGVITLVTIIP